MLSPARFAAPAKGRRSGGLLLRSCLCPSYAWTALRLSLPCLPAGLCASHLPCLALPACRPAGLCASHVPCLPATLAGWAGHGTAWAWTRSKRRQADRHRAAYLSSFLLFLQPVKKDL
uniref:zinc finger-containing protein n=1 Tax=Coelastrella saipanensis TaxID=152631 RepID=UPI0010C4C739|nr:zinc finger-containing protein [Coelastrella saipanensis]AVV61626.1 zinc finger-containing protein [Coelastrella saipanensis]